MGRLGTASAANRMVAVAFGVLALLFVVLASRLVYDQPEKVASIREETPTLALATTTPFEDDSDEDGLLNWQETLWGTNPALSDTDGDGARDGDEVHAGHDPLVSGPGAYVQETSTSSATTTAELTATEILSQSIFGAYMQRLQRDPNNPLSPTDQTRMIDQAIARASEELTLPTFDAKTLTVVTTSPETRRSYADAFLHELNAIAKEAPNENVALYTIGQGGDRTAALEMLRTSVRVYTSHIETMKRIPVPDDAARLYAAYLHALVSFVGILDGISYLEADPLRAAAALGMYVKSGMQLVATYNSVVEYINADHSPTP